MSARPRPAATVVVTKPGSGKEGLEVLLLKRPASASFAPGAHAFPGGAIDPDDEWPGWADRMPEGVETAACAAAVRELFEETGLLPRDGDGGPAASPEALTSARRALLTGRNRFSEIARRLGLDFRRAPLGYFARWITPADSPLRFDTRFFLLALGDSPSEVSLSGEHEASSWTTPASALERLAAGEWRMLFPTVRTLERLVGFPSPGAALAGLSGVEVETTLVAPRAVRHSKWVTAVRADNPGPLTLSGTQSYVIGTGPVVVLDPGPDDPLHLDRIEETVRGRPVAAVCLTHSHADHAAAAEVAARRWGPLRASGVALTRLGVPGTVLRDGETLEVGGGQRLAALATPGHSGDHLAYWLEAERAVFTGDLVLGEGSSMIAHPDGSVAEFLTSVDRLAALRPRVLMPGHGSPVDDAASRLEEQRAHRLRRLEEVERAVRALRGGRSPVSAATVRSAVYPNLPEERHQAAEQTIRACLAYLADGATPRGTRRRR